MSTIQRESDRQSTAVVGSVRLCEGMVFDTSPLAGVLRDHRPLVIALVSTPEQEKLWNHLIRAYHYLSFRALVGERIKYLVFTTHGRLIAALGWGSSVWKLKSRDLAVGWTPSLRQRSLPLVANNSRFLILPWVRVPHLAGPPPSFVPWRVSMCCGKKNIRMPITLAPKPVLRWENSP
jgi:hypothetical protein